MISAELESFLHKLEQSNLLPAEELAAVKEEIAQATDDPQQAARRLVAEGRLTGWQAQMLLAGRKAFFLGRYKLLEPLGQGGMGTVMKAEQTPIGRPYEFPPETRLRAGSRRLRAKLFLSSAIACPRLGGSPGSSGVTVLVLAPQLAIGLP